MTVMLALDTATDACSVALQRDGELLTKHLVEPRMHADRLLFLVDELISSAGIGVSGLDAIAIGAGPGSFTGVRIAAAAAQGLAYAADLPVVQVSSLAAAAVGVHRRTGACHVAVAFDARMDEIYFGAFEAVGETFQEVVEQRVCNPAEVALPEARAQWIAAGAGWSRYRERLPVALTSHVRFVDDPAFPEARDVLTLAIPRLLTGETVAPAEVAPVYLRDRVTR